MRRHDSNFYSFGKWSNTRKEWLKYNEGKLLAFGIIAICALMVAGLMLGI